MGNVVGTPLILILLVLTNLPDELNESVSLIIGRKSFGVIWSSGENSVRLYGLAGKFQTATGGA